MSDVMMCEVVVFVSVWDVETKKWEFLIFIHEYGTVAGVQTFRKLADVLDVVVTRWRSFFFETLSTNVNQYFII